SLWAQCQLRVPQPHRQRQKLGEKSQVFDGRRCRRDQRVELIEPRFDRISAREAGGVFELNDERVERAVLMVGRAGIAQPRMRLTCEPVVQDAHETRLADTSLAAQQYHTALTGNRSLPPAQQ